MQCAEHFAQGSEALDSDFYRGDTVRQVVELVAIKQLDPRGDKTEGPDDAESGGEDLALSRLVRNTLPPSPDQALPATAHRRST